MTVVLQGNSASCLTAGILLLTRARSFGHRLDVGIVGSQGEITPVEGPALVHSPVLATCGVGRRVGTGGQVIVPGAAVEPLALSMAHGGCGEWFFVDRSGAGQHSGAKGFMKLFYDTRPELRDAGRRLREALGHLGCAPEPALIDLLLNAPAPPMVRLALTLRAGRAISGSSGSLTDYLVSRGGLAEPLPLGCDLDEVRQASRDGRLNGYFSRLSPRVRELTEEWVDEMLPVVGEEPDLCALLCGLAEVVSSLVCLPNPGFLAPLPPHVDAVAVSIGEALGAVGEGSDANAALAQMYRFLGGRFSVDARYPVQLPDDPPPEGRIERWRWLCEGTQAAASAADALWRKVIDPVQ